MDSRRGFLRAVGAVGTVSLAGCRALGGDPGPAQDPPDAVGTDWRPRSDEWRLAAADHRNRRRTGAFVETVPGDHWRTDAELSARRIGAATMETVVVDSGGEDRFTPDRLRALSVADGSERWTVGFDRPVRVGGLVGNTLYATVGGTEAVALAAADGRERWRVDHRARLHEAVPDAYVPDPVDFDLRLTPTPGGVYALSGYGFHGLAAEDGAERWRAHVPVDRFEPAGPAVGTDAVWANDRRSVGAVVRLDGDGVRVSEDAEELRSAPILPDGPALVTGAVPPAARGYSTPAQVDWSFPGFGDDAAGPHAPAASNGRLFLTQTVVEGGDRTAVVAALDAGHGTLDWLHRVPLDAAGGEDATAPVVAGETVLVGVPTTPGSDGVGGLVGVDAASGAERWRRDLGARPVRLAATGAAVHAVLADGRLATLSTDGSTAV